jgi:hypothetical protein
MGAQFEVDKRLAVLQPILDVVFGSVGLQT